MKRDWLEQKSIVIIGGTAGIGWAAANSFIDHGARVVVVGHDDASVNNASAKLGSHGIAVKGEATAPGTASDAIDTCIKTFGSFDGLYHVAGGSGRQYGDGPLHEMSLEGWNKTFTLNLTSLMLSNQAAVRMFLQRKVKGTILNIGSVLGSSPSPKYFVTHAYAASKAAVEGFSRSIAAYYAANGIRINVLAPGLVDTPMAQRAIQDVAIMKFIATKQPLENGRIGHPDDLVGAALYFMSEHSRFTTGQVLHVDGGWSLSEGQYDAAL
jgi:NAD(P)-dependent dehydrogenase (short-subunit alcohol dehydrogenase family)